MSYILKMYKVELRSCFKINKVSARQGEDKRDKIAGARSIASSGFARGEMDTSGDTVYRHPSSGCVTEGTPWTLKRNRNVKRREASPGFLARKGSSSLRT